MNQVDLSNLKDIHLPVLPDFWPLATGWYVLSAIILGIFLATYLIWKWYQNQPLPYALKELEKVKKEKQIKLLSQLLKRVAMAKYGRKKVAPLDEDSWQEFLLSAAPNVFSVNQAHLLAYSIYTHKKDVQEESLYKKSQQWIKIVLKSKKQFS